MLKQFYFKQYCLYTELFEIELFINSSISNNSVEHKYAV